MKIRHFTIIVVLALLSACTRPADSKIWLRGDLYAKNLIEVTHDLSCPGDDLKYSWHISDSAGDGWKKLQGMETERIILLTSYVGKFIKCEVRCVHNNADDSHTVSVVSSKPIEYHGNPNTDWLHNAGFGIMVHYLKPIFVPEGSATEWNAAVNSFDVADFASQASQAGVGFVMFTLGQNSGYYCSPNAAFNQVVGVDPGELCSIRDLPMDLMNELKKYNIPLLLYLPSNPPINNKLVSDKFHYPYKKDSATSQFNQPVLEEMIREWSLRYGEGLMGWWFDGLYDWNGIRSTRMDMSLSHNISTHTLAAKAGNRNSIVTYNSGFGKIRANTPYCDYTSGEKSTIDEFPESRWAEEGVQWFLFTYLGEKWGGKGMQFQTDSLVQMARRVVENDGVLCLEIVTDAEGNILPHHMEQIRAVGLGLDKVKEMQ